MTYRAITMGVEAEGSPSARHRARLGLMNILTRFIALAVAISTVACSETWPPGNLKIKKGFEANVNYLSELADLIRKPEWLHVCTGTGGSDIVAMLPGGESLEESSIFARAIRDHLDQAEMQCVYKLRNGGIGFEPYYSRKIQGRFYTINVTYEGGEVDAENCRDVRRDSSSGYCFVPLRTDWSIEYSWRPFNQITEN